MGTGMPRTVPFPNQKNSVGKPEIELPMDTSRPIPSNSVDVPSVAIIAGAPI